jgi:hypothetical protein
MPTFPVTFPEIIDRYGRRRRARPGEIPDDGEALHFSMTTMDAAARELANLHGTFRDSELGVVDAYGLPAGHRRGYQFADVVTDAHKQQRDAIAQAYEERDQRLRNGWRRNKDQRNDDRPNDARNLDAAQARKLADDAWIAKQTRLHYTNNKRRIAGA